jgi:hypothetical protein
VQTDWLLFFVIGPDEERQDNCTKVSERDGADAGVEQQLHVTSMTGSTARRRCAASSNFACGGVPFPHFAFFLSAVA